MIRPLRRPSSTLTRVSKLSDSLSARSSRPGAVIRRVAALRRRGLLGGGQRDRLLGGPHRQPLGDDPGGQRVLRARRRRRPSSARAWPADSTPAATRRCTGTGRFSSRIVLVTCGPAAADPAGQLLVGGAELLQQLLVGGRLFQRVELGAVDVLQQRVAQHRVVGGVPDDRRDRRPARRRGRPAAAARP